MTQPTTIDPSSPRWREACTTAVGIITAMCGTTPDLHEVQAGAVAAAVDACLAGSEGAQETLDNLVHLVAALGMAGCLLTTWVEAAAGPEDDRVGVSEVLARLAALAREPGWGNLAD